MRRWVYKVIDIVLTLLFIMATILADLTVAVLTEWGILPDIAWLIAGGVTLIMGAVITIIWRG